MIAFYIFCALALVVILVILNKANTLKAGKAMVQEELNQMKFDKLSPFGSVKSLSVLPLTDFYAGSPELKTEAGVSYLIRADDTVILLDAGRNSGRAHPSPLLENLNTLGVDLKEIDMMFVSHLHLDHLGGMEEQRNKTISLSRGPVDIGEITLYAPEELTPSRWNPGLRVNVTKEPFVIKPGIASTGVHPRFLFLLGYTLEHSLAINVEGKGIVLIIGCGHQTIERIIERAQELFDEPVYGIIGGLHFPVNGGRMIKGPFDLQHITGSDNPPWNGLKEQDVFSAIEVMKQVNPGLVAVSPHDSSDWSLEQFRQAFGDRYRDILVGKEIIIE